MFSKLIYFSSILAFSLSFAQGGFAYSKILDDGSVFAGNFRGAEILRINSQGNVQIIGNSEKMRSRHATLWNNYLFCKKITDSGQIPSMVDLSTGRVLEIMPPAASAGVPQPYHDKLIIPYNDKFLIWKDGAVIKQLPNRCCVQWISVDELHNRIAYVHDDGKIIILNIDSGNIEKKLPPLGYKPVWSPDRTKLAMLGSDGVMVADLSTDEIWKCKEGLNFVWDNAGTGLFVQKTRYKYLNNIIYSDIVYFIPGKSETNLTSKNDLYESMPSISPDGQRLSFIAIPDGDIYSAKIIRSGREISLSNIELVITGSDCPKIPYKKHYNGAKSDLWVPYLHQCYDVPDYFNGCSSCGPTSALMAIQRYGKLPAHPITCSSPYTHTHDFGWYVPNTYEYDGYVFDHPGLAPRVSDYYSDTTVYGAHGLCCSPTERVGTYGDSLVFLINHHGLYSCWLNGTEYSVSWSTYTGEIDNGYPVPALLPGHYNCFRGYFIDHAIISNDPYGDHNEDPRENYHGAGCYYDWPGYDNGYWEASVRFLFAARGTYVPNPADTIVDDFSGGFSYNGPPEYWRAFIGGYDDHAFWTGSVSSGSDVNYATWTPNLPAAGNYEVFVYIPSTNATASARYRIFHSGEEDTVIVDQSVFSDEWVSLGSYDFVDGNYVYVGDITGTSGQHLCCDAVWFSWRGGEPLPDTIVDDSESGFHRAGSASFWHDGTGGYENHFYWTYSTYAADTCSVEWHPILPEEGTYELFVYIPDNHAVAQARYRVFHSAGEDTVVINQSSYFNEWVSLGTYYFTGADSEKVYLGDATGTSGNYIAFDAVWWHLISLCTTDSKLPKSAMMKISPNPFNEKCIISVNSPYRDELSILNIRGDKVWQHEIIQGWQNLLWNGENLSSGIYFVQLQKSKVSRKIILMK